MAITVAHGHGPVTWPPDAQYGAATPGKIGMWVFLVSDAFAFGGLLIAQGIRSPPNANASDTRKTHIPIFPGVAAPYCASGGQVTGPCPCATVIAIRAMC